MTEKKPIDTRLLIIPVLVMIAIAGSTIYGAATRKPNECADKPMPTTHQVDSKGVFKGYECEGGEWVAKFDESEVP